MSKERKIGFVVNFKKKDICISEIFESDLPISSEQIIVKLAQLAVDVKKRYGKKKGGKVALQVLKIHEHIIRDVYKKGCIGNGPIHSYYLDKRNKNKSERSERVDLEFYGEYGSSDSQHILHDYIKKYRHYKHWDENSITL